MSARHWLSGANDRSMDALPAWGRWLMAVLAYAFLVASFGLMIRGHGWVRLLGLATFAVGMVLLVRVGLAFSRERCREGDRRFMREFTPAMLVYMAVMLYVWPIQKGMDAGWPRAALALTPILPISWAIAASIRHVLASDEMERRQHLEALAIGVSLVSVVTMALGLLCAAQILTLDAATVLLFVYPAICVTYGFTRCYLVWRIRRE